MAITMAVLHNAAIFLFGLGWIHIGDLGVSVGYPIFMSGFAFVTNRCARATRLMWWRQLVQDRASWCPIPNGLALFGGSGSTLIAAEQTGRRTFLMELDQAYCDVIVERLGKSTGKKAERQAAVGEPQPGPARFA